MSQGRLRTSTTRLRAVVAGVVVVLGVTMLVPAGPAHAGLAPVDPLDGTVVAAGSMAAGRLDLFMVGADAALHHRVYSGGRWSGWTDLGGSLNSAPAVASWGPGRLDVFARGVDNTLQHIWFTNGAWSGWESLGGTLTSAPTVASWGSGRLDIFARGNGNALWHKWFEGGWAPWENLGGVLSSAPSAASWGKGRLDVFARAGNHNSLFHLWFEGGWSRWEDLGGILATAPSVAAWGPKRLNVFVRSGDNGLWHKPYDGQWRAWENFGGTLTSAPAVASWGPGRLDVFALDSNSDVRHKTYSGGWSDLSRAFGQGVTVQTRRFSPTAVTQLAPVGSAPAGAVMYSYVDNIGRLRVAQQRDPDAFGTPQWETVSGGDAYTGQPTVQQQPDGRVQIAGQKTDGDVATITHREPGGQAWGGWADNGGWFTSAVTSGKLPDGRLVLFGVDVDGVLFARQQTAVNGGYGDWVSLDTIRLAEAPTVASTMTGLRLFARDTAGRLQTADYGSGVTISGWTDLRAAGSTGTPAVVVYPGHRMRVFVRAADGTVVTKAQLAAGSWPPDWQSTGTFVATGAPAAILDPVLGRTAVVARGADSEIYRVWETGQGSAAWGEWARALSSDDLPSGDPAATDPTVAPLTTSNGATWVIVFRNANDATRVYERSILGQSVAGLASQALAAARSKATGATRGGRPAAKPGAVTSGIPGFTASTLPAPPDAGRR